MGNNDGFFEERRPAAVMKHGLLRRYLPVFVLKTGSKAPGGRVAYLDGYAGPGHYEDDSPGSPALAIETAETVRAADGDQRVDGFFVERDRTNYEALCEFVTEAGVAWPVYHGDVEHHLPNILASIAPATPLFAFLDPFGLCIPLDMIEQQILARAGQVQHGYRVAGTATEVLLNFSFAGLRRRAGHLTSTSNDPAYLKARATMLDRMDRTMGGGWWREIWISSDPAREDQIREEYCRRVNALKGGWSVYTVPVANEIDGRPSYCLLLMTQHPDGLWLFNEAVSNTLEEWRAACIAEREAEGQLVMQLESDADRKKRYEQVVRQNLEVAVATGPVHIGSRMADVYGEVLGYARERHVRQAVRELFQSGVVQQDPKGKSMQQLRLTKA